MKNIIIFAHKLGSGGTEVSLLNTINELKKYNIKITLALFRKEGIYLKKLPKDIQVIEILSKFQDRYFWDKSECLNNLTCMEKIKVIFVKILSKISIVLFYKFLLKETNKIDELFDMAIDFLGYGDFGTPYIIEKINAKKKVMFVHDEKIDWMDNVRYWIYNFDKIFCVSEACKNSVKKEYPKLEEKLDIFRNIIDKEKVESLSNEDIEKLSTRTNLLTIGRLEYQKGYDLLIDIAKELDKSQFTWYIIGTGGLYHKIQEKIIESGLQDNIILLGMKLNPYPYLKQCDIYIQPSSHEGYGIAIAEARCLNKPIIATNLACIREQIKDKETGVLCEFNKNDFVNNIRELVNSKEKRKFYESNLKEEGFKDNNDIKKIVED